MLGQYLKNFRLKNNLTQEEMSEKLQTRQYYYSLIETGSKKPGIKMIRRISKVLGVDESFIRSLL